MIDVDKVLKRHCRACLLLEDGMVKADRVNFGIPNAVLTHPRCNVYGHEQSLVLAHQLNPAGDKMTWF